MIFALTRKKPPCKSVKVARQAAYLEAMGITRWVKRAPTMLCAENSGAASSERSLTVEVPEPVETDGIAPSRLLRAAEMAPQALRSLVSACDSCESAYGQTQTLFETGSGEKWLIVSEAQGQSNGLQGGAFAGRAGLLLNNMLQAVGLKAEDASLASVIKCHASVNQETREEELSTCADYFARQVQLLKPTIVLAVGRVAAQHLLATEEQVGKLRGTVHRYPGSDIPLIVTYHPDYLLRRPSEKRKSWDDLKLAMREISVVEN